MSLHSQLLRGLLALPVMLLLAIAGVIAPEPTPSSGPVPDPAAARGELPAMVHTRLRIDCPRLVVRVQRADADARVDPRRHAPIMRGCSMSSSTSPRSHPTPAT